MPSTPAAADQSPNIFALSEAYVLGHLDEAKTKAFNALLLKDAEAREQCILAIDLMSSVNEEFRRREENAELSAAEPLLQDFSIAMNDLLRMEQQAEVIDHPFQAFSLSEPPRRSRDDNPTIKDLLSLAGYLSGKAIKSRPAQWLAAAAVVLLGITIFIALSGNTPELATNSTEQTKPAASTQSTPRGSATVATLTAEHNAVWASPQAEGALAPLSPGSPLRAGDRLTLTAGFAEITTNDGAIAILEAPATIELIDNSNALRLHAGKLVGICETESSKGFVVRTPHMDITDLGTRFGIRVQPDRTETTVLVGEVLVKTPSGEARRITHSQTARLDLDRPEQTLIVESRVAQGYIQQIPRPSLITDATLNLEGYALRVVPQGMREDAKVFTDRDYEVNGIDETGIPAFLLGGDLIIMPSDARPGINAAVGDRLRVEVEVSQPAEIYLLIEQSREIGPWLKRDYEKTEFMVGNDRVSPDLSHESLGIGPGVSIDRHFEVWKRKVPITRRTVVGEAIDRTMYAIVATPLSNNNDLLN